MSENSKEQPQSASHKRALELLSFLPGNWSVELLRTLHRVSVTNTCEPIMAFARFASSAEGIVLGSYVLNDCESAPNSGEFSLQLRLWYDRSDGCVLARLSNDPSGPGSRGVWVEPNLRFSYEFEEGDSLWGFFHSLAPSILGRPSRVTVVLRPFSDSEWLVDVAYAVPASPDARSSQQSLLCRIQFRHRRAPTASSPLTEFRVPPTFDDAISRIQDAKQDIELRIQEIDELISSLDASKTRLDERLRLASELAEETEQLKSETESAEGELTEAVRELHQHAENSKTNEPSLAKPSDRLGRAWSALSIALNEAEFLEDRISDIQCDADEEVEDIIAAVWTNAEYARGQRFIRTRARDIGDTDLSFLGPLQSATAELSCDALTTLQSSALLFHLANSGDLPTDMDHSPIIASMAKCCERIFADAFESRTLAIATEPTAKMLLAEPKDWDFEIPATLSGVEPGNLRGIAKKVRNAIQNNANVKWAGMGEKRLALLLFGGWIAVCQGSCREILNPLDVDHTEELVRLLPEKLAEFQDFRNGFVHHDVASSPDVARVWACFEDCVRALLRAFYSVP